MAESIWETNTLPLTAHRSHEPLTLEQAGWIAARPGTQRRIIEQVNTSLEDTGPRHRLTLYSLGGQVVSWLFAVRKVDAHGMATDEVQHLAISPRFPRDIVYRRTVAAFVAAVAAEASPPGAVAITVLNDASQEAALRAQHFDTTDGAEFVKRIPRHRDAMQIEPAPAPAPVKRNRLKLVRPPVAAQPAAVLDGQQAPAPAAAAPSQAPLYVVFNHHHDILTRAPNFRDMIKNKSQGVLLHFDSHDDMGGTIGMPSTADAKAALTSGRTCRGLDIGTWILPAVCFGGFNTVIWVTKYAHINETSPQGFHVDVVMGKDGAVHVYAGRRPFPDGPAEDGATYDVPAEWKEMWAHCYTDRPFTADDVDPGTPTNEVCVVVVYAEHAKDWVDKRLAAGAARTTAQPWAVSIDLDYFITRNPKQDAWRGRKLDSAVWNVARCVPVERTDAFVAYLRRWDYYFGRTGAARQTQAAQPETAASESDSDEDGVYNDHEKYVYPLRRVCSQLARFVTPPRPKTTPRPTREMITALAQTIPTLSLRLADYEMLYHSYMPHHKTQEGLAQLEAQFRDVMSLFKKYDPDPCTRPIGIATSRNYVPDKNKVDMLRRHIAELLQECMSAGDGSAQN
jgi:hypothetical protein